MYSTFGRYYEDIYNVKNERKDLRIILSLEKMANLFERDINVITRHINNIFKSQELNRNEVCSKFANISEDGAIQGKKQTRLKR